MAYLYMPNLSGETRHNLKKQQLIFVKFQAFLLSIFKEGTKVSDLL